VGARGLRRRERFAHGREEAQENGEVRKALERDRFTLNYLNIRHHPVPRFSRGTG
jgi:hypothetical protein